MKLKRIDHARLCAIMRELSDMHATACSRPYTADFFEKMTGAVVGLQRAINAFPASELPCGDTLKPKRVKVA